MAERKRQLEVCVDLLRVHGERIAGIGHGEPKQAELLVRRRKIRSHDQGRLRSQRAGIGAGQGAREHGRLFELAPRVHCSRLAEQIRGARDARESKQQQRDQQPLQRSNA
jgi:hypothetical protein